MDTSLRAVYLGRRVFREDILQRIFASILQCNGSCLCLTTHLQIAKIELAVGYLKIGCCRSHTTHYERMLDTVLVGESDVAGEVACLCRLERHGQLAIGTCSNVLRTVRNVELVGRRRHILRTLQVAILSAKHAIAAVGELNVYSLLLTYEQVAEVDELLAVKLRLIAFDSHCESHILLRVDSLIGLDMNVELISAVDELLAVVLHLHLLALAWTHLAAERLGIEHLAPVGVLAYSLNRPCKMVGYSLEA